MFMIVLLHVRNQVIHGICTSFEHQVVLMGFKNNEIQCFQTIRWIKAETLVMALSRRSFGHLTLCEQPNRFRIVQDSCYLTSTSAT